MIEFEATQYPDLPFRKALKKPILVSCIRVNKDFWVETIEGLKQGMAGDVLMIGIKGEMWPVTKATFEKIYDIITPSDALENDDLRFVSYQIPELPYMQAIKKPIPMLCAEVDDEFLVRGLQGKAGDFLLIGVSGEMYPCDRAIFFETYDWVE